MFCDIVHCLDKEGIPYFIVGGTLLGAVRHKGFIPWDDDIDIALDRENYDKFVSRAHDILPPPYELETPSAQSNYPYLFAKVYDTRTTLVEGFSQPIKRGIYIDIFPLDGIPTNRYIQKIQVIRMRRYQKIYRRLYGGPVRSRSLIGRCIHPLVSPLLRKIFSKKRLISKAQSICTSKKWEKSEYIVNYFGSWKFKEIHKKDWYSQKKTLLFNEQEVLVPREYDKVLKALYGGDYAELPPEEKRRSHHNIQAIDFDVSYKG